MPIQQFGGLNVRDSPYDLDQHESPNLSNVRYLDPTDPETIAQRRGKTPLTITSVGAMLTDGLPNMHGRVLLSGSDGDLYDDSGAKVFNSAAASNEWCFATTNFTSSPVIWAMPRFATETPQQWNGTPGAPTTAWAGTALAGALDMVVWRGRIVLIGADSNMNRVFYSNIGDPTNPSGYNTIDIHDQASSPNVGLLVHKNNLYLFKQSSVWMIYDPNTFANRLIANVGCIGFRAKCSNPYDGRIYWFCGDDRSIHSSNGETDDVVESRKIAPLFDSLDYTTSGGGSMADMMRMIHDPRMGSVLFGYDSVSNSGTNDTILEIPPVGKPGDHPIFRHALIHRALYHDYLTGSGFGYGSVKKTEVHCTDTTLNRLFKVFDAIGNDNGVGIPSMWMSGWAPIQSEEPVERIRRVNLLYRGLLNVDIASSMTPVANPAVFTISPTEFVGASDTDRTYVSLAGPNRKGRYHRVTLRGNSTNKEWAVSALEFAIRGGKEKK